MFVIICQEKAELKEKNSKLSDELDKARKDLESAARDRTLLEHEKNGIQSQLMNVQRALQISYQVSDGEIGDDDEG